MIYRLAKPAQRKTIAIAKPITLSSSIMLLTLLISLGFLYIISDFIDKLMFYFENGTNTLDKLYIDNNVVACLTKK